MIAFLILLTVVVFFHELGHYIVARLCGVKVDSFSIGFGRELFGFNDKHGTRWKLSLLPFGGYVKMHGDDNPASVSISNKINNMSEDEKKQSFIAKPPLQKIAISVAGPFANYILAVLLMTSVLYFRGAVKTPAVVSDVLAGSSAERAGILPNDVVIEIDGEKVNDFSDIKKHTLMSKGDVLRFKLKRGFDDLVLNVKPEKNKESKDELDAFVIGLMSQESYHVKYSIPDAFMQSYKDVLSTTKMIYKAIVKIIFEKRDTKDLGGPIKIAKFSNEAAKGGLYSFLMFMAMISINLGFLNLFPIPGLDGGHIVINAVEFIIRRPIPTFLAQILNYIGFGIIGLLTFVALYNDILMLLKK